MSTAAPALAYSRVELTELFLEALPEDGSTRSNKAVREDLGIENPEFYFSLRDELLVGGLVCLGRGQGGTVRRVIDVPAEVTVAPFAVQREGSLYDPMAEVIRGPRSRDLRSDLVGVEVTAYQGRRNTGGLWSRPDITSVEVRAFGYVPGKWVDVTTFEVKPADSINISAIYEARAHRTSATHAYVVLHVPEGTVPDSPLDDMLTVAREQQIGVITVEDPADYDTWNELEVAPRVVPDPALLDNFIATQLSPALRAKLSRSIR